MKERGISLIALIITIIVIIILAAISIAGVSGMVERSRYAKFCGDLDAVQDAVSQAYGTKQIKEAQKPDGLKSSEEIYQWVATGEDNATPQPATGPNGENLYQLENKNNNLGLDLPKYGDSAWGVDPKTGEVYLVEGFEYDGNTYYSKADIQKGPSGNQGESGSNTPTPPVPTETPIDTTTDCTGKYYVKIGEEYGIIFADLAVGRTGEWGSNGLGTFAITPQPADSLKQYYETTEIHHDDHFGDYPVLALIDTPENREKEDRFYVLALEDFNPGNSYCWYADASRKIDVNRVKTEFGEGYNNTRNMIELWKGDTYKKDTGPKPDIWGAIETKFKNGWFVPSSGEWAAFGCILKDLDSMSNSYTKYGLASCYWSSSLYSNYWAYSANFYFLSIGARHLELQR